MLLSIAMHKYAPFIPDKILIAADVRMQAGPSVGGEVALMAFAASEPHADATTSRRTSAVGLQKKCTL